MFDKALITENRRTSALKKDMTPLRLDSASQSGLFAGSGGHVYETSLDHCTCPDFAIQGFSQPCKHMLRLAMEMGQIPSEGMQSDIEAARGKYCAGSAKKFVKDASRKDFFEFAKAYSKMYYEGERAADDAFSASMDLATIEECPFFSFLKNGKVKVDKKWAKECESIINAIATRIGFEVLACIEDDLSIAEVFEGE